MSIIFRNDQDQLFKSISSNQLKSCRAIVGRGDVNTIDFLRDNGIAVRPFLLIRHPVDRLISSFRAIQGSETRKSKCEITEPKSDDWLIRHVKTTSHCNLAKSQSVEEAIHRVERSFEIVAVIENVEFFVEQLNYRFGWKLTNDEALNVSRKTADSVKIPNRTKNILDELLASEILFYEYFRKKTLLMNQPNTFGHKLIWLHRRIVHKYAQ